MQVRQDVTKEEWENWLTSPATIRLREWAWERQEDLKRRWAEGEFTDAMQTAMAVRNAGATGACSVYEEIQEMDFEKIGIKEEISVQSVGT